MRSRGKPAQTALEKRWVGLLAQQPCVVCGAHGVEIHEFEQGAWFSATPLCPACHRGSDGWHGTRQRWALRRMDKDKAINIAVGRAFAALVEGG